MNTLEVGNRVKTKRKELRMNQKELATALGISQPEMSNIEKGKRNFSQERLSQLAMSLKCDANWLATGSTSAVATG